MALKISRATLPFQFKEVDSGHLVIADTDKEVCIYGQSSKKVEMKLNYNTDPVTTVTTTTYNKRPKKAQQVTFSDFRNYDPDLSKFRDQDLHEPKIPQKRCEIREALDVAMESME